MRINVLCTDEGWIYSKFIKMFRKYSGHEIVLNSKDECDVVHYLPYYEVPNNPQKPCTAWMSHQEAKDPLKSKFISAARRVDVPISQSNKYLEVLRRHGVSKAIQIVPGVDLKEFKQRETNRPPNNKLVVGYVGRQYTSSNRKNPTMLNKISKLPFVEFRSTGGKIKDEDIPDFYAGLDVVVSPATIEGGPMAIQEALAVGTPIVCFGDVGMAQEFGNGVIRVDPMNNSQGFLSRLDILWRTKSFLHYRQKHVMDAMRAQVKPQTWKWFVRRHDSVWEGLV